MGKKRRFYTGNYDLLRALLWQGKRKGREKRLFTDALREAYVVSDSRAP